MDCHTNQRCWDSKCPKMMTTPCAKMDCSCGMPPTTIMPPTRPPMRPPLVEPRVMPTQNRSCQRHQDMMAPSMPQPLTQQPTLMQPTTPSAPMRSTMSASLEQYPVGMAYVPWQQWQQTYPIERAFQRGTIFPDLDLPFMMGRCR